MDECIKFLYKNSLYTRISNIEETAKKLLHDTRKILEIRETGRLRKNGYKTSHDRNNIKFNKNPSRREPNIARVLFKNKNIIPSLGTVFDYELPLVSGAHTNIDLIAANESIINLIELKSDKDNKGILKGILEIATYYQMLDQNAFTDYLKSKIGDKKYDIRKNLMLFSSTRNGQINFDDYPNLRNLLNELCVNVYIFDLKLYPNDKIDENTKIELKLAKSFITSH